MTKKQPKKQTKRQPNRRNQSSFGTSKSAKTTGPQPAAVAATVEAPLAGENPGDGQSSGKSPTFLLRLPPELRTQLELFKETTEAKSLQALLLQFIGEGLAREGEFKASELFSKDLHVKILNAAVGGGSSAEPSAGVLAARAMSTQSEGESVSMATILPAHQRVIEDLENQKLTGFAALMDPALMAYRILLQAASQSPDRIDGETLIRDFSNGLRSSADHAVRLGRWGLAETLLIRACEIDKSNGDLAVETAIFLLRRLLRRWYRTYDTLTPGVTNGQIVSLSLGVVDQTRQESDETHYGTARRVHEYFERVKGMMSYLLIQLKEEKQSGYSREDEVLKYSSYVPPRVQCWICFSEIVVRLTSTDEKALPEFKELEADLVEKIVISLRLWERSFRMTREVAALQREWKDWFEALEILWWLGYRQEAYDLARDVRGFTADGVTTERFKRIRTCAPSAEISDGGEESSDLESGYHYFFDGGLKLVSYAEPDEEIGDEGGWQLIVDAPEPLFERPDGA
jgi:hypothetical protein